MKKVVLIILSLLLLIIAGAVAYAFCNLSDRHKGYSVDVTLTPPQSPTMKVGVAIRDITPEVPDRWNDVDGNATYEPDKGDTYEDLNGNGQFDGVWIAGFGAGRAANGIHDSLWARAMVIDDGKNRLALVSIDAIGFYNPDVIDVRQMLPAEAGISYLVISSTHSHEVPDLMGLWGERDLKSGVNPLYMQRVKEQIASAVVAAAQNLTPAKLRFAENLTDAAGVVKDTRKPEVFDSGVRVMQAVSTADSSVIVTLVSMGNHPETIWSSNLLITSDYPHYVRQTVEEKLGGTAIFMEGCVGGLMCTHPSLTVVHPITGDSLKEVTWEKTEATGMTIGLAAVKALENATEVENAGIHLRAKSVNFRLDNNMFLMAGCLGLFKTGISGWRNIRSEAAAWTIGPATFCTVPGELYPEIANGGVQAPPEGDFGLATPIESPSLRELMKTPYTFVFGLANDEVGYIIPQSQWDEKPPHAFGRESAPYGEVNSLGPTTGTTLYRALVPLIEEVSR